MLVSNAASGYVVWTALPKVNEALTPTGHVLGAAQAVIVVMSACSLHLYWRALYKPADAGVGYRVRDQLDMDVAPHATDAVQFLWAEATWQDTPPPNSSTPPVAPPPQIRPRRAKLETEVAPRRR